MNIGVFDSGLGGLTIFKELIKELPQYDYIYLGDNARVPYGDRSQEIIYEFTRQAVEFLFKKNCMLIIFACNTSTAAALRKIQQEYLPEQYPERRVLGVILPTVEAVTENDVKRVGILATQATVKSESFIRELKKLNPNIQVFQQAGPLLVPFIEEGEIHSAAFTLLLNQYLQPLMEKNIDALILACTHYELVKEEIQKIVKKGTRVFSEGKIVARKLKNYLQIHRKIEKQLTQEKKRIYYVTDLNKQYKLRMHYFLESDSDLKIKPKKAEL